MEPPPVQYLSTRSGIKIAYAIKGSGAPLVLLPVAFSHVQLNWQHELFESSRRPALEALTSRFRLVTFDNRGQGMSSRGPQAASIADNEAVSDLEELVDYLQLEEFVLLGAAYSGHVAVHYALAHPERLKALILVNCPISMLALSSGLFEALPNENWEYFLQSFLAPGLPLEDVGRGIKMLREITTQPEWEVAWRTVGHSDIGSFLPRLAVPTLVIASSDNRLLRAEQSMQLAGDIPNARITIIEGASTYGEPTQFLQAIEGFLADLPPRAATPATSGADAGLLSAREIEVLRLVASGRSNQQIADELVISLNTVRRHVSNIFDKTGVTNRVEAAQYASRNGLA